MRYRKLKFKKIHNHTKTMLISQNLQDTHTDEAVSGSVLSSLLQNNQWVINNYVYAAQCFLQGICYLRS